MLALGLQLGKSKRSTAWTPASIPGLQLWLDASQIVGLNDGDAVATWTDLSGNGYNATQGTASARPTYQTAEQNSRAGVLADGVDDYLAVTNPTLTDCTLFVVGRMSASTDAYNPPLSFRTVTPGIDVGAPFYLKSNNKWASYPYFPTGGSLDDVGTSASGTAYVIEFPYELAGWSLIVNGSTLGSTTGTAYPSVAGVELFRQASPARYFNGFLFEVLVWNRVLTSNERTTVRAYLNSKWAVY